MVPSIIGISQHIENIKKLIHQIAKTEENVLVFGERGVGKDLVAQNLYLRSKRVGKPFVKINCALLAGTALETKFSDMNRISLLTFKRKSVVYLKRLKVVFYFLMKLARFLLLFKPNFFSCCKEGIVPQY